MKMKTKIQITAENHLEEQYLLERFPEAVWFNLSGETLFFLPNIEDAKTEVESAILEWEERGM